MPPTGLFTATDPVLKNTPVTIRYSVEVGGSTIYSECHDVDTLTVEMQMDEAKALRLWARRLKCVIEARRRSGFSAVLGRCLTDGQCCDCGSQNGSQVDDLGNP